MYTSICPKPERGPRLGGYAMTPVFLQVIRFDMSPCASVRFRFDSKYCSRRPNQYTNWYQIGIE